MNQKKTANIKKNKRIAAKRPPKTVKKRKITAAMSIFEIVNTFPATVKVFETYGLHCFWCIAARYENLKQAARVHKLDMKKLLDDLNKAAK